MTWEGMHAAATGDNSCNCMLDLRVIAQMEYVRHGMAFYVLEVSSAGMCAL